MPGVLLGARLSSRAPAGIVRAALVVVLLASAMKLFSAPNWAVLVVVLAALATAVVVLLRRPAPPTPLHAPEPAPLPAATPSR